MRFPSMERIAFRSMIGHRRCPAFTAISIIAILLMVARAPAQTSEPASGSAPATQPAARRTLSLRLAREQFLAGEYAAAITMYEELGRQPRHALRAAIARAAVDIEVGDYEAGIERLTRHEEEGSRSADWHAAMATFLAEMGRYEEAIEHNRKAIALDETHLRGRLQLGQMLETLGRIDEAVEAYRFFDERMTGEHLPERAEDLTHLGVGFFRFSTLTRHRDIVRRTRHVLTEVLQEAFEFVDAAYWPARLAAAELLLDKHNLDEAGRDFEHILEQNAKASRAHIGLGRIALERWDFEGCEKRIGAALDINPKSVGARLLLADLKMTERRYEEALAAAEQALQTNPNSIDALSRLAAAQTRLAQAKSAEQSIARITKLNPRPAVLHHVLGTWLSAARQYGPAETNFKKAIEFAPHWAEPRTALGQVYMDAGEEQFARETLEASFALDSFDSHTHNVLELLDSLDRFDRIETEHFIIKFDRQSESIIAPYLAAALESFHADVCQDYDTTLEKKTIIEIFPDHMAFSVRVTGRPFIATVGACSGRVIAMVAPRGLAPFGRFNWATTLRHEFAHTVTLAATENRIPHWMTEGLAVLQEPAPRSWDVKQLLCLALRQDRLFSLMSIDWGFMRPKRGDDRTLAYMQSEWMFEYIIERHGYKAVGGFLGAFREGLTQEAAFERVLGIGTEPFDAEFRQWAEQQVAAWGLPTERLRDKERIKKDLEEARDNAMLWGEFAEAELLEGEWESAENAAKRALAKNKQEIKALEVTSRILIGKMLAEKDEDARRALVDEVDPYLRLLIRLEPDNPIAIKYIGFVEQAWSQWEEAIAWLTRYQQRFPEDPDTYRRLAGIHLHHGRTQDALVQLEQLFRLVDDEPILAREVAEIHMQRGDAKVASAWYRRAMEIDPYDPATHAGLGEALYETKDFLGAEQEFRVVCKLWPEKSVGYDGLRRVFEARGDQKQSETYKKKAEEADGRHKLPGAKLD